MMQVEDRIASAREPIVPRVTADDEMTAGVQPVAGLEEFGEGFEVGIPANQVNHVCGFQIVREIKRDVAFQTPGVVIEACS